MHCPLAPDYCQRREPKRCADCVDTWNERAAILEYGQAPYGGKPVFASRAEAEQMARDQLRARVRRGEQGRLAV